MEMIIKFIPMHLIKNKCSQNFQSSSNIKTINASQNSTSPNLVVKSVTRPQTQRIKNINSSKTNQSSKQSGLIARALSSAKSTFQKLIPSSKFNEDQKAHIIGDKYIYHQDDLIGKGYSSHVYKGANLQNRQNKNFAIKILDLAKIKGFLLDLLRKEISIHKNLDHPNIVKCFDVIQTQKYIYLIQQYCSGGDLGTYISQRKSKIPEGQALNIMSQITEGYKYLIQQKILHRDLKPCNIFRCKMNDKWKIGDFGFSCRTYEEPDDINVGTPIYMPPQSLEKSIYSHKSDFFSLGVIMYEIMYGKVPWFSKSQSLLIRKMRQNKLNFQAQKHSIVNPQIKKFIQKCCQIDFEQRMNEAQFVKLQLYPRRPEEIKVLRKISVCQIDSRIKKSSEIQTVKKQSQTYLQIKIPSNNTKSYTERKNSQSYNIDKVSKTSQYSTQAQTRVINDFPNLALDQIYKSNSQILFQQNSFCKHLYYMIKNIDHFLLSTGNKELLTIVMYRHIIYLLKKLKNTKFNYFQLKKWESYKLSKQYTSFHKQVTVNFQKIEAQYFKYPKRKDIRLLREVDSKFKELDHDVQFNIKFYAKITDWLKQLIQQFNAYITGKIHQQNNLNIILINTPKNEFSKLKTQYLSPKKQHSSIKLSQSIKKSVIHLSKKKSPKKIHTHQSQQIENDCEINQINTGQKIKAKATKGESHNNKLINNFISSAQITKNTKSLSNQQEQYNKSIKKEECDDISIKQMELNDKKLKMGVSQINQKQEISVNKQKQIMNDQSENEKLKQQQQCKSSQKMNNLMLKESHLKNLTQSEKEYHDEALYEKLPNATLQALLSLLQYYSLMQSKITTNRDAHTSYSMIDLHQNYEDENILSLVRQYKNVKFKPEDITKIKNKATFF